MSAKSSFLEAISGAEDAMRSSALSTSALTASNASHNLTSRILRRGLYVVSFNLLEDFLKARLRELLCLIDGTTLTFEQLPPGLKGAAVKEVWRNATTQAKFQTDVDEVAVLQEAASAVASTAGGAQLRIHEYSFLHSGSNVQTDAIRELFAALHVVDPWRQLTEIAIASGFTALPLKPRYESILQKRHQAAHSSSEGVEVSDLEEIMDAATVVAATFDIACTARFSQLLRGQAHVDGMPKLELSRDLSFNVIEERQQDWVSLYRTGRTAKRFNSKEAAVGYCLPRKPPRDVLVVRGMDRRPLEWFVTP